MCVKFQLSKIYKGSQILRWDVKSSLKLVPHFAVKVHALLGVYRGGSLYCIKAAIVDLKFSWKVIRAITSAITF